MPVTKENIVLSSFPDLDVPDVTYDELVLPRMERSNEKVCETDFLTGKSESYRSVIEKSHRIACFLQKNGLGPGDRVGIHCVGVLEYTQVSLGIIRAGCTVVAIRGETVREIRNIVQDAQPTYVFAEAERCSNVLQAVRDCEFCKQVIAFGQVTGCAGLDEILENNWGDLKKVPLDPKEAVLLVTYSSGTTGVPKGVQLTHRNFVFICLTFENILGYENQSSLVQSNPTHVSGAALRLLNLYQGKHAVLIPSFDVENAFRAIEKHGIQELFLMPTDAIEIANAATERYDLSSLKRVFVGGDPVPKPVRSTLKERLNIELFNGYAQTEAVGCFVFESNVFESFGCVSSNVQAKVINTQTGAALSKGQTGELCVKSPNVMKGYLNNPEATKKTIDDDGWLHSGDLVYYDDQERFYFVERAKEIMKCKGCQVSPSELEQVLSSHPCVAEAVVIAIPHEIFGEVPRAYVVLRELCEDNLVEFVDQQVADYKKLRGGICIVDSLPKSLTGKFNKKQLKEQYLKEIQNTTLNKV